MKMTNRFTCVILFSFVFCLVLFVIPAQAQYKGIWSGPLASFFVSDGGYVQDLTLRMCPYGNCEAGFDWVFLNNIPISGDTFSHDSGSNHITGTFLNSTTCSIYYEFWQWDHIIGRPLWLKGTYTANLMFIEFLPSNLDFEQHIVDVGSDEFLFELKNIRNTTVTGTLNLSGADSNQFKIVSGGGSFSLTPNQTKTASVRFVPTSEGKKKASLTAEIAQPISNSNSAYLEGTGTVPILSVTPDFRSVPANSGSTTFSVTNAGLGPMSWTVLSNPADTWLTITSSSSGTNNGTILVSYEDNSGPDRTAILTVKATGALDSPKYIEVRQKTFFEWKLLANDALENGNFGKSVSISGDYAIVGADGHNENGSNTGAAYIFKRIGTDWIQQAKLTASDGAAYDYFGGSVSISGDYAIVGAMGNDEKGSNSGAAYIFEKSVGGWKNMTETTKLTASGDTQKDHFGISVSISGDYAIVGADNRWRAYIYKKSGTDWIEQAKLLWGFAPYNLGGVSSVSISEDYAIVGDRMASNGKGAAFIFVKPAEGWVDGIGPKAMLTATDGYGSWPNTYSNFGCSVDISRNYAVVGAGGQDNWQGAVYIFKKPSEGWTSMTETAKLAASDGRTHDRFGGSLSISGDYIIVGAAGHNENGSNSGAAYIFKRVGTDWIQQAKITANDGTAGDFFGGSVSISGDYTIVGARGNDENGSNSGAAYIVLDTGSEGLSDLPKAMPWIPLLLLE